MRAITCDNLLKLGIREGFEHLAALARRRKSGVDENFIHGHVYGGSGPQLSHGELQLTTVVRE